MSNTEKPPAIALADWTDWFCSNVKDPQDFRWVHMAEMANQLRQLYKQLDSQQQVMDSRLNRIIELENELTDYKNCHDELVKHTCNQISEIVALKDALSSCISDLEHEEDDGWMSGQVHSSAYHVAVKLLNKPTEKHD